MKNIQSLRMDKLAATNCLTSQNLHERLKAARFFSNHAATEDIDLIQRALREENVSWIRAALEQALLRSKSLESPGQDQTQLEDSEMTEVNISDIHAEAVNETASLFIHELEPMLGVLRLFAEKDVKAYEGSETKRQIDNIDSLLEAIGQLKKAATSPRNLELELPEMILEIKEKENFGHNVEFQNAGPSPFLVSSDKALLSLALGNGIRNAIEATESIQEKLRKPIVLNWGETDTDYWIAVIDQGIGLSASIGHIFEIGKTSKKGHHGMGLPTARQAAISLGGTTDIYPREPTGVRFELRWFKSKLLKK